MSAEPRNQPLQVPSTPSEPLDPETAARATLSLLETRLQRLEFLLTGISDFDGRSVGPGLPRIQTNRREDQDSPTESLSKQPQPSEPIPSRLQKLEADLNRLKRLDGPAGNLVRSVDLLHKHHPELFTSQSVSDKAYKSSHSRDLPRLSATVLAHAPLYHRTSAHLQTLQTLPIPPASHSTNLINTLPKTQELRRRQAQLEREAQELKERSARVLEWWVKVGVVGMGEVWEDWESRVNQVDRSLKRIEGSRKRRQDGDVV